MFTEHFSYICKYLLIRMINKDLLRNVLADCRDQVSESVVIARDFEFVSEFNYILTGIRRAGKSYLLYQRINQLLSSGYSWNDILYISFEDERLGGMTSDDLNLLLEIHMEKFGRKPILFLDELQDIDGWEKFARRVSDSHYRVYITGSNAKALSGEMQSTLGGRYMELHTYPFSFDEYLRAEGVERKADELDSTMSRARLSGHLYTYVQYGGLPEIRATSAKKQMLTSIYQKIYLGDICARHKIENVNALRLLIKKVAETSTKPVSYNRMKNMLTGIGISIGTQTIINYLGYAKDACLLRYLSNWSYRFVERETNKKYYFMDNGILKLFFTENNGALLENLIAMTLIRKFGWDDENPSVWYDSDENRELDFYVPEEGLAIQSCWTLDESSSTNAREIDALVHAAVKLKTKRNIIITYEESREMTVRNIHISVIPLLNWLIEMH